MDIKTNPTNNNTELYPSGAKQPSLVLPGRLLADLRSTAFIDGIIQNSDKWLLGELAYAGDPRQGDDVCSNCGGTGGFLVPTGEKRTGRVSWRSDGVRSPFGRKLVLYPCPVCMDANQIALKALSRVWLDDPEAVVEASGDIWWDYAGREEMGAAVKAAIARYVSGDTTGSLTLVGPYGCGKSTLAAELVRACTMAHIPALYVSADRFKKAVQESIGRDDGSSPDLDRIQNTPVVVFDQIDWLREQGAGGYVTFTAERARDVFHARYAHARSRATVYVVNTDAWEKAGVDALAAIYDRMKQGEVVTCTNTGMRQAVSLTQVSLPIE